jgi:PAS domain S-box-containing protein
VRTSSIAAELLAIALARRMLVITGMHTSECVYEVDRKGKIVHASDAMCRALRCTRMGLIGRDVRQLLRPDFRPDFRLYVARAMVGTGSAEIVVPIVAPCGEEGWFKHMLVPLTEHGKLIGYRATVVPPPVHTKARRWWQWPAPEPRQVWNFEPLDEPN